MDCRRVSLNTGTWCLVIVAVFAVLAASGGYCGQADILGFGEEERCPVCAMSIKDHPKFACAIESTENEMFYFCGTGCMIRSWLHPEIYLNIEKARIKAVVARDYFTGKKLDGQTAFWVAGSDVIGPMGPAIVALESKADVMAFKNRHGGKHEFKLSEMTDEMWERITGKKAIK